MWSRIAEGRAIRRPNKIQRGGKYGSSFSSAGREMLTATPISRLVLVTIFIVGM